MLFICYPRCSTCQKAKKWLDEKGITYRTINIKEEPPKPAELKLWHEQSGLPLKRFWNTSGTAYRALGLKDRLGTMQPEEQLELLAGDGMLIKRPLLVGEDFVLVGFKEAEWEERSAEMR